MCHRCDYPRLMEAVGLGVTANRLRVLEAIGNHDFPMNAREIYENVCLSRHINRVTVYRILDLLVEKKLVERISGAGRSFFYGLAPNEHHVAHPHFYCRRCGNMQCLKPEALELDPEPFTRSFPGTVENVEIRFDGICQNCMNYVNKTP